MTPTANSFDFSPLEKLKTPLSYLAWTLLGLLLASLSFVLLSYDLLPATMIWVVFLGSIVAGIKAVWSYRKAIERNQSILSEFATMNNLTYQVGDKNITGIGTIFEEGHDKRRKNIFGGTLAELPFQAYAYYYTTGSGKSSRTHDTMVFEITLSRVLPQFVIDSQLEAVIPMVFDRSQKIELEGDFHKYFDLYAPDTYGVSALTVLAPDAMETLMEKAVLCDIEVIQNKLFFYFPVPPVKRTQYETMFDAVETVLHKLSKKLNQDDIYATASQAKIHAIASSSGARLKRSKVGLLLGAIFVLYFASQILLGATDRGGFNAVIISLFWFGIVGWIIISVYKQAKLKKEYTQRYDKNLQ